MNVKGVKGSFTVEAALVFPIVLFVIISLIYMSFYLHDTALIKSVIDKAVIKEGMIIKHPSNFVTGKIRYDEINKRGVTYSLFGDLSTEKEMLEKYLKENLVKGLFFVEIERINIELSHSKSEIGVKVKMTVPLVQMREYFGGSDISETIYATAPVHQPTEYARRVEVIYNAASKIKGFDELKEKVQKFIQVFK